MVDLPTTEIIEPHLYGFQLVSTEWCEFYYQNIRIELINTNNSHQQLIER